MQNYNNSAQDRVFTRDEFKQFNQLNLNTNSRIPIFFCIDVSGSMAERVGFFETRLSLLTKVLRKLLENMKKHPVLSERAVIGMITYNNKAFIKQVPMDLSIIDINNVTNFVAENQTVFSLGLHRTLQSIDQYRESLRRSDVETFTPMLVFMTDGEPVGDSMDDIEEVYSEIWNRIGENDLYVFPIGISRQANMSYVYALTPNHLGYQMNSENDFENVFKKIGSIVETKQSSSIEEGLEISPKASVDINTMDTGMGSTFDIRELEEMLNKH